MDVSGIEIQAVPKASELPAATDITQAAIHLASSAVLSSAARSSLSTFFATAQTAGIPGLTFDTMRTQLLAEGESAPRAAQRGVAECVAATCASDKDRVASMVQTCVATLRGTDTVCLLDLILHLPCSCFVS
jgi:hypothetical protein